MTSKAPSTKWSCLISHNYSWACKAFKTYVRVVLDISFMFSKVIIDASYLLDIISRIFSTILELVNLVPCNLTLLTMLSNLFEYSLIVLNSIFCNSNSLIKFNTYMPHIFFFISHIFFLQIISNFFYCSERYDSC